MSYLYGDSTPSTLEVNFIEFLRDAVDFCVQVLSADQRIVDGKARTRTLERTNSEDIARLEKIAALVPRSLEGFPVGEADSAGARCVANIVRAAEDIVRAAKSEVTASLDGELKKRDEVAARDREGCERALEALLVKHDLPDMKSDLHVALVGGRYACRMHATTAFGLDATLELEVPPNHLFEKLVRVDRVMEKLEVQVPELGGWIHKEIRLRAQHFEKHHIVDVLLKAGGDRIKLRAAPEGKGAGFDILYSSDGPPRIARIDDEENGSETFDVEEGDRSKLLALRDRLAAAASELARHRKAVVEATVEGEPLRTHSQPSLIVERLVATLAPVVQEISARSQSTGELVLRRSLGGDRREEIFLSKDELKLKIEPLKGAHRALFDPLWLSAIRPPEPPRPRRITAPIEALAPAAPLPVNGEPARSESSTSPATPISSPSPVDSLAASLAPPAHPGVKFGPSPIAAATGATAAILPPPPPPPARSEPTQTASGVIELGEVDVSIEDRSGPSNKN